MDSVNVTDFFLRVGSALKLKHRILKNMDVPFIDIIQNEINIFMTAIFIA